MIAEGRHPASFRDPSGFIFHANGELLRQINGEYQAEYTKLCASGLLNSLQKARLVVSHDVLDPTPWAENGAVAILRPEPVPFISYPYEWSFGQLKAAALATLEIHRLAVEAGFSLKDASAYNIQFLRGKPILIDTLSFESLDGDRPWRAYRQFCSHFLAPLALMAHVDPRLNALLAIYLDGIPLDLATKLLPWRTKLNPGLQMHLHLHAKAQLRSGKLVPNGAQGTHAPNGRFGLSAMMGLIDSLRSTIERLDWTPTGTEWADYYQETNYEEEAMEAKKRLVSEYIDSARGHDPDSKIRTCWDLGANTGEMSRIATSKGIHTVAWDVDPAAVERAYRQFGDDELLLPLRQDLTNPSPGLGWGHRERESFESRGGVDIVLALALVHHLAIGNNVPLPEVASTFARIGRFAIVEFVPKEDSQVVRMLSTREDVFPGYTVEGFEKAFRGVFETIRKEPIPNTHRTLYLLRRRNADA